MGSMTRLEMSNEIVENLDNRDDVTSTQLARWINHTYSHLTHPAVHPFEDLAVTYDLALVAGTSTYSLSEATLGYRVLAIRGVSYIAAVSGSIVDATRRRRMYPKPIQWYDGRQHPTISEPNNYIIGEEQTLIISDTPNNANTVRLRLFREAAKLTLDTSVTALPEYFDEVLLMGTQALAEFKLGMRDRANETFQMYNNYVRNALPKDILEGQSWGIETQVTSVPYMGISS